MINCTVYSNKNTKIQKKYQISSEAININIASAEELEKLPNVGAKVAERIIEHRNKFGKFRRVEHLLLIQGISDKRFRKFQNMIKVE